VEITNLKTPMVMGLAEVNLIAMGTKGKITIAIMVW
jgi:hypothetical protein